MRAAFPSVTPVCAASIATGSLQDRHHIPSMNWWWRDEKRYVEYGSSFGASRKHGINRQLVDTVYRMNMEHLSAPTRRRCSRRSTTPAGAPPGPRTSCTAAATSTPSAATAR